MKKSFWKRDWFLGLLVTLLIFSAAGSEPVRHIEWAAYDLGVRFSPERSPSPDVAVVAIDAPSLKAMGPWPWSRDRLARLVGRLAEARVAVVAFTLPLDTPQNRDGLDFVSRMAGSHPERRDSAVRSALDKVAASLDTDGALARSFAQAGNVVLGMLPSGPRPLEPALAKRSLPPLEEPPADWMSHLPTLLSTRIPSTDGLLAPITPLLESAAGVGHLLTPFDRGQRAEPLLLRYGDALFPSFALLAAIQGAKLPGVELEARREGGVRLAGRVFHADGGLRAYPYYYPRKEEGVSPFPVYSFIDVDQGRVPAAALRAKTVLVGLTDPRLIAPVELPTGDLEPPVIATAHIVSSLINGDLYAVPEWVRWVELATLAAIGLYLMLVLPRFRLTSGVILSLLVLFILLNGHFILMLARSTWVPLMVPVAALLVGQSAFALKRLVEQRVTVFQRELSDSNRTLAQLYQSQGQLDAAFDRYVRCDVSDELLEQLYTLGLDYERKRQFNKAVRVFETIQKSRGKFRDVAERIQRNRETERVFVLGKAAPGGGDTLILSAEGLQKPMLGRYQIERELGRGAMGLVYLGKDPKIGRTVAIKTMALSQEFESDQLEEVRQRFFREAETAGRLNHPNIVTIYDVGEEQDLAYIAMDYLKGAPLSSYCKPDNLLPFEQVLEIAAQVADALDYAHKKSVVHRDIKPANIVYDAESGAVKVTDFGVACLSDSTKTKTGTILGSPSYMSPEQLAGHRLDGRSDLFSLGITVFQLLTAQLPFQADSLASLMYKITHERHPDVRKLQPDAPECIARIINKALQKEMEKRFQDGQQMAGALRQCRAKTNG